MKTVSILATGSEVVSGQIINTNAAWLAQRLTQLNVNVVQHWVVADDSLKILEAFEHLSSQSDAVFVIGGLGPTTDDLTRKLVADWLGQDLILADNEWQRIQKRVSSLHIKAREGHKWQAYFPAQAEVYTNGVGTASGFSVKHPTRACEFYFLPGPPIEFQFIWERHLHERVKTTAPVSGLKLLTWQFLELPESEVAYIAEPVAQKLNFLSGYRATPPIVEFKLWVPPDFLPEDCTEIKDMELKFKDRLHSKNEFNYLKHFCAAWINQKDETALSIIDEVTQGELLSRIESLKLEKDIPLKKFNYVYATSELKNLGEEHLRISGSVSEGVTLNFTIEGKNILHETFHIIRPMSIPRFRKWVCEKISKALYQELSQRKA